MINSLFEMLSGEQQPRQILAQLKEVIARDALDVDALRSLPAYDASVCIRLLSHEDAKTRKNMAALMGLLVDEAFKEPLIKAYQAENTMYVKSAYLKALSSYPCDEYKDIFIARMKELTDAQIPEESVKHVAEELRELKKLLPKGNKASHVYRDPLEEVQLVLTCPKEARELLLSLVQAKNPRVAKCYGNGVLVRTKKPSEYRNIRIFQEMLFVLNEGEAVTKELVAKSILEGNLFSLLTKLHQDGADSYAFRVTTKNLDAMKIAGRIEAGSRGRLVNSVSDYEIEIRLVEKKDGQVLSFLKIYTLADERFAYRKKVVATSSAPYRAAWMVEACRAYLMPKAQIYDPCCGVGTLLIERDYLEPTGNLYGTDIYQDAIIAGRENGELAHTSVPMHLIHRSFHDFAHEYLFDEIMSQLPDWEKSVADEEYRCFISKAIMLVKPHGRIMVASTERGLIHKYLRLHKDKLRLVRDILVNEKKDEAIYIMERL